MVDETVESPIEEPQEEARPTPDDVPLTAEEVKEVAREVVARVKNGVLVPVWRLGRRYLQSLEEAADSLLDGVTDDDKGKKGKR